MRTMSSSPEVAAGPQLDQFEFDLAGIGERPRGRYGADWVRDEEEIARPNLLAEGKGKRAAAGSVT
jgi:hypothetical protein